MYDVRNIYTHRQKLSNSKLVLNQKKNVSYQNMGNSSFIIFIWLHSNVNEQKYYVTSVKAGIYWRGVCFITVWVWHYFRKGVYIKSYFALLWVVGRQLFRIQCIWRILERVCVEERTYLVKYRSNIWHNLFKNEACQKALNLWNRKCSLARTKLMTVRIKHMDRQ